MGDSKEMEKFKKELEDEVKKIKQEAVCVEKLNVEIKERDLK